MAFENYSLLAEPPSASQERLLHLTTAKFAQD
jgi:hypothetical protein